METEPGSDELLPENAIPDAEATIELEAAERAAEDAAVESSPAVEDPGDTVEIPSPDADELHPEHLPTAPPEPEETGT